MELPILPNAQALGEHALAWSAVGAVIVGLGTAGLAALALPHRADGRPPPDPPSDAGRLPAGPILLMGWLLVLAAASAFAALAAWLSPPGVASRLGAFDEAVIRSVHSHLPAWALWPVAALSHLGDFWFLLGLGLWVFGVLWRQHRRALAWSWALALAGNGLMTRLLKVLFERTRPEHWHELAVAHGASFPSGHSSGAMVAYGWCAYLAWRLLPASWRMSCWVGCALLIWCIGCSRVLLQVHYPSDVLAGWLSGGAWCLASILAVDMARRAATHARPEQA